MPYILARVTRAAERVRKIRGKPIPIAIAGRNNTMKAAVACRVYHCDNVEFTARAPSTPSTCWNIEGMTSVTTMVEAMHGAGSPQAQRIVMLQGAQIDEKIKMAERVVDGTDDVDGLPIPGAPRNR